MSPPRRVAIVQSNYIPWKGYFDLMRSVDEFVLLDEVQYTRRDWRNRNRIKTAAGLQWLTVPVVTRGRYHQRIDETRVSGADWRRAHWSAIERAYGSAPYFEHVAGVLEPLYRAVDAELLSEVNLAFLQGVRGFLGIETPLTWSTDYAAAAGKSRRLLDICLATGATEYVSGPAAQAYLDVELFAQSGVEVSWFDYSGYPSYRQPHGEFEHQVSVIDLLFCEGPDALRFIDRRTGVTAP